VKFVADGVELTFECADAVGEQFVAGLFAQSGVA
jgi:hypothetical protein